MVEINIDPEDLKEYKKRGAPTEHPTKRVAKSTTARIGDGLGRSNDSEDEIFEMWVDAAGPDRNVFRSDEETFPPVSRLADFVVVYKEVDIGGYRVDAVLRHPNGAWELIEVKRDGKVGLSVLGHLIGKRVLFEDQFMLGGRYPVPCFLSRSRHGLRTCLIR
ncbi:hypothetical protein [Haloarchaeobius iranensis]|uniref:hypothetical protein n=1 Tax=Haloarchaeobius iranensis TaxID=996166 RepID=UPI001113B46D|nr:hypothetical protein [Haloarchaeobius iranensis]